MPAHKFFLSLLYVWCICKTAVNSRSLNEGEGMDTTTTSNETTPAVLSDKCDLPANPKEFPFMALIGYGDRGNVSWECSGTLISSFFVLSAAYCAVSYVGMNKRPSEWVRLGDLDITTTTDDASPNDYSIIEIIKHPDYNIPRAYNDIVLYKLDRQVVFNDYIKPVCLRRNDIVNIIEGRVMGWRIEENGPVKNPYLLKAGVSVLSNEDCSSKLKYKVSELKQGIDWRSQICTTLKTDNENSCLGDVGGPLLGDGDESCVATQVGITSRTIFCNAPKSYCGISTKVSYFVPWIETIVKLN